MADLDAPLNAVVDAVFAALNAPHPEAIRALATDSGWAAITPRLRSEPGQFARFPAAIVNGDRAAVRGMTAPEGDDDRPDPLWLGFARTADEWKLAAAFDTRPEAQAWLAQADTRSAPEDDLHGTVERVAQAVQAGDADALKALSTASGWAASATTPSRMIRFAAQGDVRLVPLGPARTAGERAAVHMAWLVDGRHADTIWLCLRHTDAWRLEGQVEDGNIAALWLRGVTEGIPSWASLPPGTDATAFVEAAIPYIGTEQPAPRGSDVEAWAALIAPSEEGLEPRIGEAKELPSLGRALVQLGFYSPDDPDFAEEDRWALLERTEDGWRLIATRYLRGMGTLLEGITVEMPAADAAPTPSEDDPVAKATAGLEAKLAEMFAKHAIPMGPDGKPDLSGLSKEQLEAMGPDIAQSLLGGFAAALGGLTEGLPAPRKTTVRQGVSEDPDVVDLAAERAKRGQRAPVDVETEVGRSIQAALSGFVGKAAKDTDRLEVDAEFLKNSGPELAAALFGGLAKALVPDKVTVPVEAPSANEDPLRDDLAAAEADAGQRTVNVELDLGSLLGGLFAGALRGAADRANEDTPDEPE